MKKKRKNIFEKISEFFFDKFKATSTKGKKYPFKWLVWTAIYIFFENPAGSLFRNYVRLPSCRISEKIQWVDTEKSW